MSTRRAPAAVLAIGLLLTGCTGDPAPRAAPTTPASPGPLTVTADRPDGGGPLPSIAVSRTGVGERGTPVVVYDDLTADDDEPSTRIGLGPDPTSWSPVSPTSVESGTDLGSLVVGEDGSVTALAVLNGAGDAFGLHVLRVGPDGTQTATRVPDAGIGTLGYATADAVSDDGRTAVVATTDRSTDDPAARDRVEVLTVDLTTATVTARTVADLGTDVPADLLDVGIDADGAVTVLVGRPAGEDPGADVDGAELARFGPGLQYRGLVVVDTAARFQATLFDLTADGTAVVSFRPELVADQLLTRVVSVDAGSTEVVPVVDLERATVDALVSGPDGWVHLQVHDYESDTKAVLPLDLGTGAPADPVALCPGGQPVDLARSGSGSTVLARVLCDRGDYRLLVLTER